MWVWCSQIVYHCGARCRRVLFEIHRHRKCNITLRAIAKHGVTSGISLLKKCRKKREKNGEIFGTRAYKTGEGDLNEQWRRFKRQWDSS